MALPIARQRNYLISKGPWLKILDVGKNKTFLAANVGTKRTNLWVSNPVSEFPFVADRFFDPLGIEQHVCHESPMAPAGTIRRLAFRLFQVPLHQP